MPSNPTKVLIAYKEGHNNNQSSGLYLTGGISWNSVTGRVTDTGLVYYPPICDPWFWWCYPGGVAGDYTETGTFWLTGAGTAMKESHWNSMPVGFSDGDCIDDLTKD